MLVVIRVNQERIWYTAWWNYGILWEQLKFRVSLGPRESWPYGPLPQRKWSSGPGQIARHIGGWPTQARFWLEWGCSLAQDGWPHRQRTDSGNGFTGVPLI